MNAALCPEDGPGTHPNPRSVPRLVEDYLRTYEALLMSANTSPSGA